MGPKNFSNAVDRRKLDVDQIPAIQQELDSIISLPPVTSEDAGKMMEVSDQGEWELITPEVIDVEANPDGDYTEDLYKLKVGNTIYKVNDHKVDLKNVQKVKVVVVNNTGDEWNVGVKGIRFTNARNMQDYTYLDASISASVNPHYGSINNLILSTPDYTRWRPAQMPFDIVIDFGTHPIDLDEFNMIGFIPDTDAGISFGKIELYIMKEDTDNWILINDDITISYANLNTRGYYTIYDVDVHYIKKTLTAGATSLTFESPLLTSDSPFLVLDNTSGMMSNSTLAYTASISGDVVTLTFTAQASDVDIAIFILTL